MSGQRILKIIALCLFSLSLLAQNKKGYEIIHFTSSHTSFPDTGRVSGHMYDSVLYSAAEHYNDSSVMLIVPEQLSAAQKIDYKKVDLVFWFHGWRNNIDTAAEFYGLTRQFIASHRNAVLVLAETAKNSPDSYGGKLEQPGVFKDLVQDVMNKLKNKKLVDHKSKAGNIIMAGHSGAFRVIAYILQNGGLPVQEVFLFDALYGQLDKYTNWIYTDPPHSAKWINAEPYRHFVHWFTNHGGGTDEMTDTLIQSLKIHHTDYSIIEELNIQPKIIKNNRILFVHSLREHNVIINDPDNFQLLLENSFVLRPLR
jgi:hypothetical protein